MDALSRQLENERAARAKLTSGEVAAATAKTAPRSGVTQAPPAGYKLQPADTSRQPTVPYDLQRIRASQPQLPALDPGWGAETTVTEPITGVPPKTDPALPVVKPPKK